MRSPYEGLPEGAFWRAAFGAAPAPLPAAFAARPPAIRPTDRIATAGCAIAPLLHAELAARGWNLIDTEPLRVRLPPALARTFHWGTGSARFGPVHTPRQFLQLCREAMEAAPRAPLSWGREGRVFDALRPAVEPWGYGSFSAMAAARAAHRAAVARMIGDTGVLVFELDQTEAWTDRATGRVFPAAPGTIAGRYEPAEHECLTFGHDEIVGDLRAIHALFAAANPDIRVILTLSPVPAAAAAAGERAWDAAVRAKAVLRAACETLCVPGAPFGYFPAFELLTDPAAGGAGFDLRARRITEAGRLAIVRAFFGAAPPPEPPAETVDAEDDDEACAEILAEVFRQ